MFGNLPFATFAYTTITGVDMYAAQLGNGVTLILEQKYIDDGASQVQVWNAVFHNSFDLKDWTTDDGSQWNTVAADYSTWVDA